MLTDQPFISVVILKFMDEVKFDVKSVDIPAGQHLHIIYGHIACLNHYSTDQYLINLIINRPTKLIKYFLSLQTNKKNISGLNFGWNNKEKPNLIFV